MSISVAACRLLLALAIYAAIPGGIAHARTDVFSVGSTVQLQDLHAADTHQQFHHKILHEGRVLSQAAMNTTALPAATNGTTGAVNSTTSTGAAVPPAPAPPVEPATVVEVQTAQQLLDAVTSGQPHILVTKHLILEGLPLIIPNETSLVGTPSILGVTPVSLQSITGYCLDPPPQLAISSTQSPLRPFVPGQCLLAVDQSLLVVNDSNLWLNSLYIRITAPRNETFFELVYVQGNGPISEGASAAVFITNVTLQGNGDDVRDCLDCGITADLNAGVYAEDCLFMDFDGSRTAAVYAGATANFVRCQWENSTLVSPSGGRTAAILADGFDDDDYYGYDNDGDALVRLEECTFTAISPVETPALLADDSGDDPSRSLFWSDQVVSMRTLQPMNGTENNTLQEVPIQSVVTVPEPLSAAPNLFFLDQTDSWFMSTQQALQAPTQTILPAVNSSFGDPGTNTFLPPLAPDTNTTSVPVDISVSPPLAAPVDGTGAMSPTGSVFEEEDGSSVPQTQPTSAVADPFVAAIPTPSSSSTWGLFVHGYLCVPMLLFTTALLQVIV